MAAGSAPCPTPPAGADREPQRLQKLLAAAGFCSRRRAEELIRQGRVRINGRPAELGERADPRRDSISIDGRPLGAAAASLTLLLNKPAGVLCSCHDPHGRPTVLDLLPPELARGIGLHPVGRLDADSRGALLLSNDGVLTLRLTHPRYNHRKTYRVWVAGQPSAATLMHWRRGVPLEGRPSQPVTVQRLRQEADACLLELTMGEGRNRQIRRTASLLGHPVRDLQRLAIGSLGLGNLAEGQWRRLETAELALLSGMAVNGPLRAPSTAAERRHPRGPAQRWEDPGSQRPTAP